MIPQEYIQEVVRRNDIEEVIGQYVQLRRRGRTLSGLCPFHNEKTPSFVVGSGWKTVCDRPWMGRSLTGHESV